MNRRDFLSTVPAALSLDAVACIAPEKCGPKVIFLGVTPNYHQASERGLSRAWDNIDEDVVITRTRWFPDDLSHPGRLIAASFTGRQRAYEAGVTLEREEDDIGKFVPTVFRFPTLRLVTVDCSHQKVPDKTVLLEAQHERGHTVIRIPRLWEAQMFRQFSLAPAQPDGSRTLADFEQAGMRVSDILWHDDELMADILAAVLPHHVAGQALVGPVGRVECLVENGQLKGTILNIPSQAS